MRWWKVLGLAGIAGVAATGVVIARAERQRQAYTPDEIRTRLRARLEESAEDDPKAAGHAPQGEPAFGGFEPSASRKLPERFALIGQAVSRAVSRAVGR